MKILVAIDDLKCSTATTRLLTAQVRTEGTHVRLLHVVEPFPFALADVAGSGEYLDVARLEERKEAESLLAQAAQQLHSAGFDVTSELAEGDVESAILEDAKRWPADLIVVGTHDHRRGLARILARSVSDAVAHHAQCPVEIVPVE